MAWELSPSEEWLGTPGNQRDAVCLSDSLLRNLVLSLILGGSRPFRGGIPELIAAGYLQMPMHRDKKLILGMERWLSGKEDILLLQGSLVWFPGPIEGIFQLYSIQRDWLTLRWQDHQSPSIFLLSLAGWRETKATDHSKVQSSPTQVVGLDSETHWVWGMQVFIYTKPAWNLRIHPETSRLRVSSEQTSSWVYVYFPSEDVQICSCNIEYGYRPPRAVSY